MVPRSIHRGKCANLRLLLYSTGRLRSNPPSVIGRYEESRFFARALRVIDVLHGEDLQRQSFPQVLLASWMVTLHCCSLTQRQGRSMAEAGCGAPMEGLRSASTNRQHYQNQRGSCILVCSWTILYPEGRCQSNENKMAKCGVTHCPIARAVFHHWVHFRGSA